MELEVARAARQLFEAALELDPESRAAFLETACDGNPTLRSEVDSLLAHDRAADGFMAGPAVLWGPTQTSGRLGPYRILEKLGEGGMAQVYLAERTDEEDGERVAIKLMRDRFDTPEMRARFYAERNILASFQHPNIARLIDGGSTSDAAPYVVMELVRGTPITAYCDRHRLSIDERLAMLQQVCGAVHYAHQHLVVHRDIKPSNVLVTNDGQPKLLDFGIAKILDSGAGTGQRLTATERRILTPRYASPEHILGERISITSDVYSLGVLLYELLSGRLPYDQGRGSLAELAQEIRGERALWPSRAVVGEGTEPTGESRTALSQIGGARSVSAQVLSRRLRGDLDTIVLRCLRGDPALRYPSVHELSEDIGRYRAGEPIRARPPSRGYLLSKFVRRHRIAVANGALVLLLIVSSAVLTGLQSRRISAERDLAQRERVAAEQERNRADAVTRFLVDSFEAADPYRVRDAEMTAREVLERGAERVDRQLSDQPEARGSMLYTVGRVYLRLGVFDRAQELLTEAVAVQRTVADSTSRLDLARSLRALGNLKSELGELEAAVLAVEEALEIQRQELTAPDSELADSLRLRADLAARLGDYALAERLASEALEMERLVGGDPEHVANSLDTLTKARLWGGNSQAAETSGREALTLARTVYEEGSANLSSYLNHLAVALWQNGRSREAEPLFVESLRSKQQALGERHPSVASALNNLANLRRSLGRHEEAEPLLRESLLILQETSGGNHPNTAQVLANLGVVVQARGALTEAELLFRRSWSMNQELLGEDHTSTMQSADLLTRVLIDEGEYDEARAIQRQVLETRRRLFGEANQHVATSILFLAYAWHKEGDLVRAERLYRESRANAHQSLGDGHWLVARIEVDLADVLAATGRLDEAIVLADRAVAILDETFPEKHPQRWRAAYATSILGGLKLQAGDRTGEALLLDSHETLQSLKGDAALVTREAKARIDRFGVAAGTDVAAVLPLPPG